jgi:hypothetical protein
MLSWDSIGQKEMPVERYEYSAFTGICITKKNYPKKAFTGGKT